MPSPDMAALDQLLSLAFSLHTSPGSYAFVLGAGISVPSGVPSAWGVQEQLIQKVAAVENESPTDPFECTRGGLVLNRPTSPCWRSWRYAS